MRRARFSPILAFLLTACSLLGPHPVLDCGASQDDADCIAVLTAAADRFPTAARLQMSDRPRPLLLGGEVWYVDATFPDGSSQTISCGRTTIGPIGCDVHTPPGGGPRLHPSPSTGTELN